MNDSISSKLLDKDLHYPIYLKNQNMNFMITHAVCNFLKSDKSMLCVLPTLYEAERAYSMASQMLDENNVLFFPADELLAAQMIDVEGDFKYERINTLISLLDGKRYLVLTNLTGAVKLNHTHTLWNDLIFKVDKKSIIDEKKLYSTLNRMGYHFSYTVTKTGEYSHRGSIIDIFPLNYSSPIRIDLFGDEIDTIKYFDVETQRSQEALDEVKIAPVSELLYNDDDLEEGLKKLNQFIYDTKPTEFEKEKIDKDIENLSTHNHVDNLTRYARFFSPVESIMDFMNDPLIYIIDYKKCEDTYQRMIKDIKDYSDNLEGHFLFDLNYFVKFEDLITQAAVLSEGVVNVFNNGTEYEVSIPDDLKANEEVIIKYLNQNYKKYTIIITIQNQIRFEHLEQTLLDNHFSYEMIRNDKAIADGKINILLNDYLPSFKSNALKLIVLNEATLFNIKYEPRKTKYKSVYKNTSKISHYDELEIGDYVVHFDYGIGIYKGLQMLETSGIKRDYIKVEYDNGDNLYVPLEQISSLEKYNAGDAKNIKLSSLGTKKWSQAKEKVRRKLQDISQGLIKLYANRSASVGYAFAPDTPDQVLFEADFGYELTPDQKKAIIEIKREMESNRVMDRLVCGDVGYGKTEIALRAAFKAVESGKQVAVLAPTTILSRQHYYTFKNRMERFGIRVDLLNRLQKISQIKATKEGLLSGEVDVVIGTHKLLGKDIKYKDLGLLIIDEEQRFGVTQKEKIKEIKLNVDAITLSATPIPRTLQMSMMGIKTLSMLETPPKNRYPVQTYVLERNELIIKDAIEREMTRHGQVFYMYNFKDTIYDVAHHLQALVPDCRICVGHGGMDKEELEGIITDFIDKKYDMLVCTTIIETGIDIPDANTLIVHDANRLGLSQLYQLRGRVGRSDKIAYAYLMYEPNYILTEQALKRLDTIKEFNELGSGFKIAMRDLSIRGAGDILGDEQSGFIETVGLETYLHLLDEELHRAKNPYEAPKEKKDPSLTKAYANRFISSDYINNEDVKIEIHKRIAKIERLNELYDLQTELLDRFGKYDSELDIYMHEMLLNKLCDKLEIKKILDTKSQMILFMSQAMSSKMDGNKMFELANKLSENIVLNYYNRQIEITINKIGDSKNYLITLSTFLDMILDK